MTLKQYKVNSPSDYEESPNGGWVKHDEAVAFALEIAYEALWEFDRNFFDFDYRQADLKLWFDETFGDLRD